MKDKIKKNYLNQSTAKGLSPSLGEYTFKKQIRRTLGSQQDLVQKISWNISSQNLTHFYSPPKTKLEQFDLQNIIQQNKRLKQEVKSLKQLLIDSGIISKTYEKIDSMSKLKKDSKTEQIQKLKKLIQKSHYSIKYMQSQLSRISQQYQTTSYNLTNLQKRYKILQFQKQQLQHKISNINLIHRQEIQVCHERIRRLDIVTQQLVEMIEQDQRNWALHMEELNNLKKFYSNRTYK